MLERWIAFGVLVGLLLVFAGWVNEDEPRAPVEPREAVGLPPEMPEDDDDDGPREPKERKPDGKRPKGLVGGLLGDGDRAPSAKR